MIVAEPVPTPFTIPFDTVATPVFDDDQAMLLPLGVTAAVIYA